jgi:hypothetical protein
MAITVASRKAKGRKLQNWMCEKISNLLDIPWGLDEDYEIRSQLGGQRGVDVIMSPRVRKMFPFSIECKNQETWTVHKDINQAKANVKDGTDWLLVYKRNCNNPVVVLDAEVFIKLIGDKLGLNRNTSR